MKKFASALAAAAALGAAANAQAVTFQIDDQTEFTVYGNVQIAYTQQEQANNAGEVDSVSDVIDNGTTIGVAGEHRLNNGLTGYFKIEEDGFDAVDSGTTVNQTDEAYVGVKGDFGAIQFGRNDSLYDDTIGDYWDYQEVFTPTSPGVETQQRALQYTSPDFGGFSFGLEAQINGDAEEATFDDATNEVVGDVNGDDAGISLAAALTYSAGDLVVEAAIDQRSNVFVDDVATGNPNHLDNPIYGIAAGYTLGQVTLTAGYQIDDREEDEGGSIDVASVGARFNYGAGDLYGVYQNVSFDEEQADGEDSYSEFALGANYGLSDNMYVYVEYVALDQEDDEGDSIATGVFYGF
jgi:predicted porin